MACNAINRMPGSNTLFSPTPIKYYKISVENQCLSLIVGTFYVYWQASISFSDPGNLGN